MKCGLMASILIMVLLSSVGCIEQETQDTELKSYSTISYEMQRLQTFLKQDTTNNYNYYDDLHRGIDYYVCSGFARDLAKNANNHEIKMGGVSLRDTMSVGVGTRHYHAMNYCIIDNRFIVIEPQSDKIYYLNTIPNSYKYITIFPNAQMMTNYGKHKETIDIDLSNYNESEVVKKWS